MENKNMKNDGWDWIDTAEVLNLLHIHRNTLHRYVSRGLIHRSKPFGKRCYYRRSEIERLLESHALTESHRIDETAFV